MKKIAITFGFLALATPLVFAQTTTWTIDPAHSEVNFVVRHMSVSNVRGRIGGLKGTIVRNEADLSKSTVSVIIGVSTIDTGVGSRDADLKSANFFDVARFPTATFTSTGVTGNAAHFQVNGSLTLHGITRPVQLDVDGTAPTVQGMDHKPHTGYSATTTLNRRDFGIALKYPASVVGDEIKLTIDLEVAQQ